VLSHLHDHSAHLAYEAFAGYIGDIFVYVLFVLLRVVFEEYAECPMTAHDDLLTLLTGYIVDGQRNDLV
jgi:hypothetical protein